MIIYKKDGLPIKIWSNEIEESAQIQAENLAKLPFAYNHIEK